MNGAPGPDAQARAAAKQLPMPTGFVEIQLELPLTFATPDVPPPSGASVSPVPGLDEHGVTSDRVKRWAWVAWRGEGVNVQIQRGVEDDRDVALRKRDAASLFLATGFWDPGSAAREALGESEAATYTNRDGVDAKFHGYDAQLAAAWVDGSIDAFLERLMEHA